jgi:formylmethanofuran dehydrogenase subunit C
MPLTLRLLANSTIPINVDGILPETLADLSMSEIAERPIWQGNQQLALGELFQISGSFDQLQINWQGELTAVHWIGHRLSAGSVVIEGNVGRHVGSQMAGGTILVNGDASDFVGCEMGGGTIQVRGSVGDWAGGAYPGTKTGVSGGQLIVHGRAGSGLGFAMRRGLIAVTKDVGRVVGWNMLAGTVVIGGTAGDLPGTGLVRGSIILAGQDLRGTSSSLTLLSPTFRRAGKCQPAYLGVLGKYLRQFGWECECLTQNYQLFSGDMLHGGRGELLVPAEPVATVAEPS